MTEITKNTGNEEVTVEKEGVKGKQRVVLWQDRQRIWFLGLPLTFTKYTLTSDKLKIDRGFLTRQHDEVRMYRVLDVSVKQTLGQRIIGVGDILVRTSDRTLRDFTMKNIKNVLTISDLISEMAECEREAKRVSTREFIGGNMSSDDGFEDEEDEDTE